MLAREPFTAVKATPLNVTLLTVRVDAVVSSVETPTTRIRSVPEPKTWDQLTVVAFVVAVELAWSNVIAACDTETPARRTPHVTKSRLFVRRRT